MFRPNVLVFDPGLPNIKDSYRLSTFLHPAIIEEFDAFLISDRDEISKLKKRYGLDG